MNGKFVEMCQLYNAQGPVVRSPFSLKVELNNTLTSLVKQLT